jgi:hypothetical protein
LDLNYDAEILTLINSMKSELSYYHQTKKLGANVAEAMETNTKDDELRLIGLKDKNVNKTNVK